MADASRIKTCLWYDEDAEVAANFYTALIPHSTITDCHRPTPGMPALMVEFTLAGIPYQALNGGPHFQLSEAASIVVLTEDQRETDRLWAALTADGGCESRCGWLKDRFGLSWQIVPRQLGKLLGASDRAAANRAMQAMMAMHKLDIAALESAFYGNTNHA